MRYIHLPHERPASSRPSHSFPKPSSRSHPRKDRCYQHRTRGFWDRSRIRTGWSRQVRRRSSSLSWESHLRKDRSHQHRTRGCWDRSSSRIDCSRLVFECQQRDPQQALQDTAKCRECDVDGRETSSRERRVGWFAHIRFAGGIATAEEASRRQARPDSRLVDNMLDEDV